MGDLKKTVIKSFTKEAQLKKKASNLLVDNFDLSDRSVSVYGYEDYLKDKFKEQYPNLTEVSINEKKCVFDWDVSPVWTGMGFQFEPYIVNDEINLGLEVSVWTVVGKYDDGSDKETDYTESIEIPLKGYEIKIEYNKTDEEEIKLECMEIEINLEEKRVEVIFNV